MKEVIIPCVPVYTTSFLLRKKSSFVLAEADKMDWSFLTRQDVMRVCTLVAGLAALELLRKKIQMSCQY